MRNGLRWAPGACAAIFVLGCGSGAPERLAQSKSAVGGRTGVDYAWARPDPAGIAAAGYSFAVRYHSYDTTGKNLSAGEAQALIAAGVDVVSNWEWGANDALSGYNTGVSEAQTADAQAASCGMPAGRPIYFSVDFDAAPGDQTAINSYFDGVASVIGLSRTGAYGGYYVIQRLFDAGKISFGWQTYAWSGGQWDSRAQLRQVQNGVTVAGGDCDIDDAQTDDFGQWHAIPPPRGYLDSATCTAIAGWAQDQAAADQPISVDLYFDAPAGQTGSGSLRLTANNHRDDLCTAIMSCNHGFSIPVPLGVMDGKAHSVYAYAIAASGNGPNPLLSDAPKSFTCAAPGIPLSAHAGIKRWVTNPTSFAAWKFNFLNVAQEPPAAVSTYQQGPDVPATPTVVISDDGSPPVWVVDGNLRRHVVDPTSLSAWQFSVVKWPAAKVNALTQGPDWPASPFLFVAAGQPAVYVLDTLVTAPGNADGGVGEGGAQVLPPGAQPGQPQGQGPVQGEAQGDSSSSGGCSVGPRIARGEQGVFLLVGLVLAGLRRRRRGSLGRHETAGSAPRRPIPHLLRRRRTSAPAPAVASAGRRRA